jgi:hypothetical protein
MDDSYTFKKINKDNAIGCYIGCFIDDRKHYFNWEARDINLNEKCITKWSLTSYIETGIVHINDWNKSFFDLFEKYNIKELFIEKNDEIIQRFILHPHKLKLGIQDWIIK